MTAPNAFSEYLKNAGVTELPKGFVDHTFPREKPPKLHQIIGLNNCLTRNKWGLFDDTGTGKTRILQAVALYYIQWGNRVIGVMPPILFNGFIEALHEDFPGFDKYVNLVKFTSKAKRDKTFERLDNGENINLILMTYETFLIEKDRLKEHVFSVVLTDEAQKLRVADSDFYSGIYNYTDNEDTALVVATGTPIFHTPLDGYAMTNIVTRDMYKTYAGYKRRYCDRSFFRIPMRRGRRVIKVRVEKITGYKNLEEMHKNLYANASRVEKDDVWSLKEPRIVRKRVEMSAAHRKVYSQMANERMLELPDDRVITARQAVQLREHLMGIACNPHLYTDKAVTDNLFILLQQLLAEIGGDSKVIIYAHHNQTVESLYDRLEEHKPALIYGGERRSNVSNAKEEKRFRKDYSCRILCANPESAGVGLNFQHVCHDVIFYEPTSIHGKFSQAMDRVHRGGQKHVVMVYLFNLLGTVYPKMIDAMLDNSDRAGIVNCDKSTFSKWVYGDESR